METILVQINNSKAYISSASKKMTAKEKEILAELEDAVEEVNEHKKGKVTLKAIQQVLNEF